MCYTPLDKSKMETDRHHEIYNYFHDCFSFDTFDELQISD